MCVYACAVCACMFIHMCACICECMCLHVWGCVCVCMCVNVRVPEHMYAWVYVEELYINLYISLVLYFILIYIIHFNWFYVYSKIGIELSFFYICSSCFHLFQHHLMKSESFLLETLLKSFEDVDMNMHDVLWTLYPITLCTGMCLCCYYCRLMAVMLYKSELHGI